MTESVCTCPDCLRTIREAILATFASNPRWLGMYQIRFFGRLGWVPMGLYRESLAEAVDLGVLVESFGPRDEFPRYLHWRLAAGPKGGGR